MSFPRYSTYRDSGVEWLGEVPSHWDTKRLKWLGKALIGLTYSPDDVVGPDDGILVLRSSNVQGGKIALGDNVHVRAEVPDELRTRKGDILICSRNGSRALIGKNAIIDETSEGLTFGTFMTVFRSQQNDYLFWVFNSALFEFQSGRFLTATINQLTVGTLNNFEIPLPPASERIAIAAFLDRETAKIDALVEEQRRLIELLQEKRQAVISHAVTRGLDPSAKFRYSGVEWLGEVPTHWGVAPLKRAARVLPGYAFSAGAFSLDSDHWRLLRGINVSPGGIRWSDDTVYWARSEGDGLDAWELRSGDIVLGMDRPWIGDGLRVAEINDHDLPCMLLQRVAAVRADCPATQRFILHCLRHEAFFHHCAPDMTGVSVPHISGGQIEEFRMPLPPTSEMQAIADHIDRRSNDFSALIRVAQSAIDLLTERRAAMISAAVTGKIDVTQASTANHTIEADQAA